MEYIKIGNSTRFTCKFKYDWNSTSSQSGMQESHELAQAHQTSVFRIPRRITLTYFK